MANVKVKCGGFEIDNETLVKNTDGVVSCSLEIPEIPEIPVADYQADSVAEDVATLVTDFNGLLAKLQAAGLMATE